MTHPFEARLRRVVLDNLRTTPRAACLMTRTAEKHAPDLVACHKGRPIAVFLTRPEQLLSSARLNVADEWTHAGAVVLVAHSWKEVAERLGVEP